MWWCQHCSWHCTTFPVVITFAILNLVGYNDYTVNLWDALKCERITVKVYFFVFDGHKFLDFMLLIVCKEEQITCNLAKWALTNVNQVLYGHENRVSALKVSLRNSLNCIACFLSSYVCWRPLFSLEIEHLIQISKKVKEGEGDFENCWCIAKRFCQTKFLNITFSLGSPPLANISQIYCQLNHQTIFCNFYQPKYLICPYFSN